jgi:hypothetical protein
MHSFPIYPPLSKRAAFGVLFIGLIIAAVGYKRYMDDKREPYIAYIGRYANPQYDRLHEVALRHFIADRKLLNGRVGLKVRRVDADGSTERIYADLAQDNQCIAVIDSSWLRNLRTAQATISKESLPVISINSDKWDTDFKDRVLFLGHDDKVAEYLVGFLGQRHRDDKIVFVGENPNSNSTGDFRKRLKAEPLSVSDEDLLYVSADKVVDSEWNRLREELLQRAASAKEQGKEFILVLNVHGAWGRQIVLEFDRPGRSAAQKTRILSGVNALSTLEDDFKGAHGTELLVLSHPNDTLSPAMLRAMHAMQPQYGGDIFTSRRNSGFLVSRCAHVIDMVRSILKGISGDSDQELEKARRAMLREFRKLGEPGGHFATPEVVMRFDKQLRILRVPRLEFHDANGVSSFAEQFDDSGNLIPNIYVGLEIHNIRNVDIKAGTFAADFSFSLRYDPSSIRTKDIGRDIFFPNAHGKPHVERIDSPRASDGDIHFRASGEFTADFDGSDFPYDTQTIAIEVSLRESIETGRATLSFDALSHRGMQFTLPTERVVGWSARDAYVGIKETTTFSGRQTGAPFDEAQRAVNLSATLSLDRKWAWPLLSVVCPLVAIGLCAVAILFVEDLSIASAGELSVGLFIGFIGYLISYRTLVPELSSLCRADRLLYATFAVVLVQLFLIIFGNAFFKKERMAKSFEINRLKLGRRLVLAAYLIAVVWSLPISLWSLIFRFG